MAKSKKVDVIEEPVTAPEAELPVPEPVVQELSPYSAMVNNLAKPGDAIIEGLTPESAHLWHMATGISGEVGELLEYVLLTKPLENFIEESGDTEFYIEGLCQGLGIDVPVGVACVPATTMLEAVAYAAMYASQVLDAVKKCSVYVKDLNYDLTVEAVINLCNAMTVMYGLLNVSRQATLDANVVKLCTGKNARYKDGYSDKAASDRADKVDTTPADDAESGD